MEQETKLAGVYFVLTDDERFVKIGFSQRILARFGSIRGSAPAGAVRLIGYLPGGTRATEKWLHSLFAAHRDSGEWFRYTDEIQAFASTLAEVKKPKDYSTRLTESMYLSPEEIAALFRAIQNKRDRAIFRLAYHRGLRAHEVGLLQYSDFRERDCVLYVRRGKGSISADHHLVEEEARVLRAWLRERGSMPGPMFPSRQGRKGITRVRLDQLMKEYCAAAGIRREKAHMHALKHSCGTHLAERGNSPEAIQDWLGHRDPSSTAIYMHFSRRRREESVEKNRDWR